MAPAWGAVEIVSAARATVSPVSDWTRRTIINDNTRFEERVRPWIENPRSSYRIAARAASGRFIPLETRNPSGLPPVSTSRLLRMGVARRCERRGADARRRDKGERQAMVIEVLEAAAAEPLQKRGLHLLRRRP